MDGADPNSSTLPGSNDLAAMRTALALDRTLLAWVRTALTLFGFGFTLAKFVHSLIEDKVLVGIEPSAPRHLGFALMILGVVAFGGGTIQYFRMSKVVPRFVSLWSASFLITCLLTLLSITFVVNLFFSLKTI